MGQLIPLFWTSGNVSLGFKARVDPSLACFEFLFVCNEFLRFTSGATPADCIEVNMAAKLFRSTYLQTCPQALVEVWGSARLGLAVVLRLLILCAMNLSTIIHYQISFELEHRNTDQLNPLFHIFVDLVNRVAARQTTDWLVPNSKFSPTVMSKWTSQWNVQCQLSDDFPNCTLFLLQVNFFMSEDRHWYWDYSSCLQGFHVKKDLIKKFSDKLRQL